MNDSEIMAPASAGPSILPSGLDRGEIALTGDAYPLNIATVQTSGAGALLQRVFSFPALLGAAIVGATAIIARAFVVDPDVWWHIKNGQVILATHHWPTTDPYSFSVAGQHWIAFEWIGDVLLATMYRLGGLRGLELLVLVLASAILIALYALAAIRSGNSKAAFVATAAVFLLATASFNLRPQMLGYLFLILTFIVLERFRQGKRRGIWVLPALMLVWVNAHGSWIIGLGVIGIYLVSGLTEFRIGDVEGRRWSHPDRLRLTAVLGLCVGGTLITPYGTGLAKFPFEVASSLPISVANIIEWQPMPFGSMVGKSISDRAAGRYRLPGHTSLRVAVGGSFPIPVCRFNGLPACPFPFDFRADFCSAIGDYSSALGATLREGEGPVPAQCRSNDDHSGGHPMVLSNAVGFASKRRQGVPGCRSRISQPPSRPRPDVQRIRFWRVSDLVTWT